MGRAAMCLIGGFWSDPQGTMPSEAGFLSRAALVPSRTRARNNSTIRETVLVHACAQSVSFSTSIMAATPCPSSEGRFC